MITSATKTTYLKLVMHSNGYYIQLILTRELVSLPMMCADDASYCVFCYYADAIIINLACHCPEYTNR